MLVILQCLIIIVAMNLAYERGKQYQQQKNKLSYYEGYRDGLKDGGFEVVNDGE